MPESRGGERTGRYEMRIGVAGHRDLPEQTTAEIEVAAENLAKHLLGLANSATEVAVDWVVVTPAARGADILLARALARVLHARIEVILPLPLAEHEKDFVKAEDLANFRRLCGEALTNAWSDGSRTDATPAAGSPLFAPSSMPPGANPKDVRDRAYQQNAIELIKHVEILVVAWDGAVAKGPAGTAATIGVALAQARRVYWIDTRRRDPVAFILTAVGERSAGRGPTTHLPPRTVAEFSPDLAAMARFMGDDTVSDSRIDAAWRSEKDRLEQEAVTAGLDAAQLAPVVEEVLRTQCRADLLAIVNERRHKQRAVGSFCLAALAVTFVATETVFRPQWWWLTLLECLAMVAVFGWYWAARFGDWHGNWLRYRYLAEQLRSASFSAIVRESEPTNITRSNRILPFYEQTERWLAQLISAALTRAQTRAVRGDALESVRRFVISAWLEEQRAWHERKRHREERAGRRLRGIVLGCFGLTLLAAVTHLSLTAGSPSHHPTERNPLSSLVTLLAIILPAWGASAHGIAKQLEHERIAARSEAMAHELARLAETARAAGTVDELMAVVEEVEALTAFENHEWRALLSFDPPEVVA